MLCEQASLACIQDSASTVRICNFKKKKWAVRNYTKKGPSENLFVINTDDRLCGLYVPPCIAFPGYETWIYYTLTLCILGLVVPASIHPS